MDTAIRDLEENYSLFEHEFTTFFEELVLFSRREFQKLVK
jgi:hypothetical protein